MALLSSLVQVISLVIIGRITQETLALRDVRIRMPHTIRRGQQKVLLKCLYDIEDDILYAVKWYKGRREFYRYTPSEEPPMKIFQFPGIRVDRSASNATHLVLESATMATAGKYSCEVSADAPSFHTLIAAADLLVVELPHNPPLISGIRQRYHTGDILRGNCTTRHSNPAANLTWTVNDEEVQPSYERHIKIHKENRSEIQTTTISIYLQLTEEHFALHGKLKLRCTAQIGDIYFKTTEKIIHNADYHHQQQQQQQQQQHHYYHNRHNQHDNLDDNDYNNNNNNIDMLTLKNGYGRGVYNQYALQGQQLKDQKNSNYITHVQELSVWSASNNFQAHCVFPKYFLYVFNSVIYIFIYY